MRQSILALVSFTALAGCLAAAPVSHVAQAEANFRFAVYGDDRDGHDIHRQLVALIGKEKPAFVMNTGDLVKEGGKGDLWKIFDDITGGLRKTTPYFAVPGNHDFGDTQFMKRFPAQTELAGKNTWFAFDKAGCHFVALCVDEHTDYEAGTAQYKWLKTDLEAHKGKSKHIFVFFHVPPYSIGNHGSDLDVRKALCPLFEKNKVDAVFNGHDHNYYRTVRNGVTYVVTGGGGAHLYECDPAKGAIAGDKWEKVFHYVTVEVADSGITVKAIRVDGSLLDSFKLGATTAAAR